mmetsp:Transcript_18438/g.34137  ORF Transcript_18438/g.34137 Transcript_18438/m.34137 type:complete len:257 (+) Transcript_18438:183-953(+)
MVHSTVDIAVRSLERSFKLGIRKGISQHTLHGGHLCTERSVAGCRYRFRGERRRRWRRRGGWCRNRVRRSRSTGLRRSLRCVSNSVRLHNWARVVAVKSWAVHARVRRLRCSRRLCRRCRSRRRRRPGRVSNCGCGFCTQDSFELLTLHIADVSVVQGSDFELLNATEQVHIELFAFHNIKDKVVVNVDGTVDFSDHSFTLEHSFTLVPHRPEGLVHFQHRAKQFWLLKKLCFNFGHQWVVLFHGFRNEVPHVCFG